MLDCFTRSFSFQSWVPPPVSDPGFSRVTIPPFSGVVNIFHFLSPNLFLDIEFSNLVDAFEAP